MEGQTTNTKIKEVFEIIQSRQRIALLEQQNAVATAKDKLARQVSHDIRSPLAALSSAIKRIIKTLEEEDRVIIRTQIQRISDIANNLLSKNKDATANEESNKHSSLKAELLTSCIETLLTDKRLEFRSFLNLDIEGDLDNSYGLFANVNSTDLKRILSNLINNAREAFDDNKGKIVVRLEEDDCNAIIIVEDNGKGIPSEILAKLGQEGASFGKSTSAESGSGIGLYSARTTIEKWGGTLKIESTVGLGTKMIITLSKITPPEWFLSEIRLKAGSIAVILDDDAGIHQVWDSKFTEAKTADANIEIIHVSTPEGFRECVKNIKGRGIDDAIVTYFCDYELLGHKENGLDLIEEMGLEKRTVLVTSRYEESPIRIRTDKLKVKLVPKMAAGQVPIIIERELSPHTIYNALYLDDAPYLRMGWEKVAKKNGIKLITISIPDEFYKYEGQLCKETTEIYLDSNLGDGVMKGEEFAVILHDLGYKKISMASGYETSTFAHLPWLAVRDKESPWETEDDW
ncbi:MAG: HAMP domain-containing histidine kinase [Oligoflexia bacterium]|nr:HAMP domain-containing histidine kinase [Oligoflexia bacterium]